MRRKTNKKWFFNKDIYRIKIDLCKELIDVYDKTGRQLYNLNEAWTNFKRR